MGIKRRRTTTIKKELGKYIATLGISVVMLLIVYFMSTWAGINTGLILPANYTEQFVDKLEQVIKSDADFTGDMLPHGFYYALFDRTNGDLKQSSMNKKDIKLASAAAADEQDTYVYQKVFRTIVLEKDIFVLQYFIRPQFSNSFLRGHLPNYETTSVIALIIVGVAVFFIITTGFAKKLKRHFDKLDAITHQIKNQDLSYFGEQSNIKEFNDIITSLQEMRKALKRSLEEQWRLEYTKNEQIGALAHDIKIPITIIKGNTELLGMTPLTSQQKEYNQYVKDAGDRIEQYTRQLIMMSKSEKALSTQREYVFISSFISKLQTETRAFMGEKSIRLTVRDTSAIKGIYLDYDLMYRALINVLINAVEHTPDNGEVILELSSDSGIFRFTVTDSGSGFTVEEVEKSTNLFYMSDKSRSKKGHYGIGLAFVKNAVNYYNGQLYIQNSNKGGGEVIIEIPLQTKQRN